MERLSVRGLALGIGVSWGVCMLLTGWAAAVLGWGLGFVDVMSSVYIGFKPGFLGGVIGGVWGFADGAIGGAIIALIYNLVSSKG